MGIIRIFRNVSNTEQIDQSSDHMVAAAGRIVNDYGRIDRAVQRLSLSLLFGNPIF